MPDLPAAVAHLRVGGIVAFPTDTYYGLAVDPCSAAAVSALFDLKGRDARMAVPLIAASLEQVTGQCGAMRWHTARLAERFWPGPLSLIMDAPDAIAAAVHAGTQTVAVRVPAHDLARQMSAAFGGLLTATSANQSGAPPARTVAEIGPIAHDARVLVVDGGTTAGGAPSTIVDARMEAPMLIREGAIAWSRVLEFLQG